MSTRSLDGAVYNEVVDAWMIPQPDPYTLANFQAAYDKLAAGRSVQTLSKAQAAEFTPAKKLSPTHYALKIYPRDEEEQWRVEKMEDVQVAYIPFSFAQLTAEEAGKVEQSKTRSAANTFSEKSPYTVTYNYTEATDGGPVGPKTFQLPILYTVWPVEKSLPNDLEYVVDYEVLLPRVIPDKSISLSATQILYNEAMVAGSAVPPIYPISRLVSYNYEGNVKMYDNTLGDYIPIANLKVKSQFGSNIKETTTDSSGNFKIIFMGFPMIYGYNHPEWEDLPITFTYQDPAGRWKITTGNGSTTPLSVTETFSFECASSYDNFAEVTLPSGTYRENTIHRAVNYFYNDQTVFPKHVATGGVTIIADSNYGRPSYSGYYEYDPNGICTSFQCTIAMFNRGSDSRMIGDTLHEIGHMFHGINQQVYDPIATHNFFSESFACYVGWYLGEAYYTSFGWIKPGLNSDITYNGMQSWTKNYSTSGWPNEGWYSPLFIDMTDNYNQSTVSASRPDDDVTGVSAAAIWDIVLSSRTWDTGPLQQQCRPKIVNLVGTAPDFDSWIDNFDNWAGW